MITILLITLGIETVVYLYGAKQGDLPCFLPKQLAFCG